MRRTAALVALAAVAVIAGCGDEESGFSDGKVASTLELERRGAGYEVDSNPFCTIDQILNDAAEIEDLAGPKRRLAITSRRGNVGVVVVTPFAPRCKRAVIARLNRLDREPQTSAEGP